MAGLVVILKMYKSFESLGWENEYHYQKEYNLGQNTAAKSASAGK